MVDSIGSSGGPQNPAQVNRTQNNRNTQENRGASETQAQDEVQLSDEALVAQAQQLASDVRAQLQEDPSAVLTRGSQVDTLL